MSILAYYVHNSLLQKVIFINHVERSDSWDVQSTFGQYDYYAMPLLLLFE